MRSGPWWDKHIASDWEWVGPPSRPSLSELLVYEKYMVTLPRNSRIMILGSTAELRDMCFLHRLKTVVVDYDADTFHVLGGHLRHPEMAEFVNCDWRDVEFVEEFDAVIGDLALNMMPVAEQETVLSRVAASLVAGGLFVHRSWVHLPAERGSGSTLEEVVSRESETGPYANHFYSLAMPLITHFRSADATIDFQDLLGSLRSLFKQGLIDADVLDEFERPWNNYHLLNWVPDMKEHRACLGKYFDHLETGHGSDPYRETCPIFALRKR
jgi:hypothetical protein